MKKNKQGIMFLLFFLVLFFLGFYLWSSHMKSEESFENETQTDLQIVVARYNENLEWLKDPPFNQYPVIVYNKGPNQDFYHAPNIQEIIPLKNVGRESHTYLYHIIQNYENLADITVFLPGSSQVEYKLKRAKMQVTECAKHNNTVFIYLPNSSSYHPNGVGKELYDFQLDDWISTDQKNKNLNPENKLLPAEIHPFGKWYEARFPNVNNATHVSYGGVFGICKKHILQHPKSYYENLIRELSTHSNPEAGHYFERAWAAVFAPNEDAVIL